MALEKQVAIDKIEILENGIVQVREITRILEDGVELSASYHRWTLAPKQDISDQPEKVQAICNAAWTPEVISTYEAQQAANQLGA